MSESRCPRCGSSQAVPSGQPCDHPFHATVTGLSALSADQLAEKVRLCLNADGVRSEARDATAELVRRASERDQAVRERLTPQEASVALVGFDHSRINPVRYGPDDLADATRHANSLVAKLRAICDAGSSSGRTPGFGPGNEGSIPSPAVGPVPRPPRVKTEVEKVDGADD